MTKYINMIMRNEDPQGGEKMFDTFEEALKDAIWMAENASMTWREAKKHRIEIVKLEDHGEQIDTETELVIPFVRIWKVEVNLHTDNWQDFQAYPETSEIKARKAEDAASDVMTWFDMDDIKPETAFKVFPVDKYGDRLDYAEIETFTAKGLGW